MKNKFLYGALVAVLLIGVGVILLINRSGPTTERPVLENVSPSSGSIGTEVTIRGSGFTSTSNDIAFTHPEINFQERHTAYLSQLSSLDGKTLKFNLPDALGACAYSQLNLNEACPEIGILLPKGVVQISVINKNGTSGSVTFTVE